MASRFDESNDLERRLDRAEHEWALENGASL